MTLGKLLNLSDPEVPHLENGYRENTYGMRHRDPWEQLLLDKEETSVVGAAKGRSWECR